MLDSGFRISDLNNIPVNGKDGKFKNRIALDNTYLLSYAHTVYGINYNKHNYKIPLMSIRDDIKGYIGIESLVAPWSEQLKLWHGSWQHPAARNKSYVYQWTEDDKLHEHYAPEKFNDKENSYYIIKDAPFPYESGELNNRSRGEKPSSEISEGLGYANTSINVPIKTADPHPDTNKIVTKAYVDERLASKRLVEVSTDFYVRDYDCTYIIRSEDIRDNKFDNCFKIRYPESFNKRALHNKIEFSVLIEGVWSAAKNKWVPAITSDTNWKFFNSEGNEIEITWLNNTDNTPVQISEEYLYDNAQYLVFRFETVTDDISIATITENIEGKDIISEYKTTANYKVFANCENLLYRATGIKILNNLEGIAANIKSSDNSIKVQTTQSGSNVNVDLTTIDTKTTIESPDKSVDIEKVISGSNIKYNLSVDVGDKTDIRGDSFIDAEKKGSYWQLGFNPGNLSTRSYIQKLADDGVVDLSSAANKTFWTDNPTPKISVRNAYSIGNEIVSFNLFLKTTEDTKIDTDIHFLWGNTINDLSPTFKANRLYHITFTNIYGLVDDNSPFGGIIGFGKINWFIDSDIIDKTIGWADYVN